MLIKTLYIRTCCPENVAVISAVYFSHRIVPWAHSVKLLSRECHWITVNTDQDPCHHVASLGHSEMIKFCFKGAYKRTIFSARYRGLIYLSHCNRVWSMSMLINVITTPWQSYFSNFALMCSAREGLKIYEILRTYTVSLTLALPNFLNSTVIHGLVLRGIGL